MVTGSYLYGLAVPGRSDVDIKEIYDHCQPKSIITDTIDLVQWPLSLLMKVADRGGHNGLEVLMCRDTWPEVDLLTDFRRAYRANGWVCKPRFESAAKTLRARGDQKGEDRANMLADWLEQIFKTGRCNPHYADYMDITL